jgi:hypothetical protein
MSTPIEKAHEFERLFAENKFDEAQAKSKVYAATLEPNERKEFQKWFDKKVWEYLNKTGAERAKRMFTGLKNIFKKDKQKKLPFK